MSQEECSVFVVAFQSLSNCLKVTLNSRNIWICAQSKAPHGFLGGMASGKEEDLMSVSMIYNTPREWIFVMISSKVITGSVGYDKGQ